MLHLKDLRVRSVGEEVTVLDRKRHPLSAMFLKRYDSKRVRGSGSVNDMKGKGLAGGEQGIGVRLEEKSRGRSVAMAIITGQS